MSNCKILDCTLRDGGYINSFNFGRFVICDIINKLSDANTDIIECGFLKSNEFDENKTLYGSIEAIGNIIPSKNKNAMYVAMIAYGDISIDEISDCSSSSIDGIRLTFHQDKISEAFEFGQKLMSKNYKVFMQPVGTTSYSEEELTELIKKVNELKPFAFYMVDTLGTMFNSDLREMFELVDMELNKDILIGFHSHNNLQLSFSNAIELLSIETDREIIIDSSVFGMGRGAGNLCTELIMEYINKSIKNKYDIVPVLEIYDEHINKILLEYKWGYSLPYFLASINNCHPNYATHLINKQTMTIKQISCILSSIGSGKKERYSKSYVENLYLDFQKHIVDDKKASEEIKNYVLDRNIVLLAPGKSVKKNTYDIKKYCSKNNSIIFSVNFIPEDFGVDFLFVSNYKRIKSLGEIEKSNKVKKVIVTSNLLENCPKNSYIINYSDYLNEDDVISDNAGLMIMNFLKSIGITQLNLAGFDGFSMNSLDNYYDSEYMNSTEYENLVYKTEAIAKKIKSLSSSMKIKFLTESRYE